MLVQFNLRFNKIRSDFCLTCCKKIMTFRKLYFILFILLTSCAVNQIQTPVVQINSVATYRPMCFLEYIERGDYGALNDSVSRANEQLILQELHDQLLCRNFRRIKNQQF